MSILVAFVISQANDEIAELREVPELPRTGEKVRFTQGAAMGDWQVTDVMWLPGNSTYNAVVELAELRKRI